MNHEHNRCIVIHEAQGLGQVVAPGKIAAPWIPERHKISQPQQPEGVAILFQPYAAVFVNRNAFRFESNLGMDGSCAALLGHRIVPPIMIAQNGVCAQRRFEAGKGAGRAFIGHGSHHEMMGRLVVAQQKMGIAAKAVGQIDDLVDARFAHMRAT
jgi:hypothetical protein